MNKNILIEEKALKRSMVGAFLLAVWGIAMAGVSGSSFIFVKDPIVLMKSGIKELLLAAPQDQYVKPFQEKLLPLKDQLHARAMAVEIIKTGRRLWLTIRFDPRDDDIRVDDFMQVKATLSKVAREVYENTDTYKIALPKKIKSNM